MPTWTTCVADTIQWCISEIEYNGVQAHDADYRERMQVVAESNNYGLLEAGQTANVLASGGVSKGKNQLRDLGQVEKFSRAYGTNADEMSQDFASLRKMGTLGEGEMNRFANLIGGAVAKNGMRGREAEMLQSTMTLVQSGHASVPPISCASCTGSASTAPGSVASRVR
jgi:hypothetical protein